LLIVSAVVVAGYYTGTVSPSVVAASPIPDAVTFRPEQVILPPEQFPLTGYGVDTDAQAGTDSWTRMWSGPGAFPWVSVDVTVLDPSERSYDAIAAATCDHWTYTPPALSSGEIRAPVVGDGAKACAYSFQGAPAGSVVYTTGTRNVVVTVGVWRRSATEAATTAFVASLADYQLWIIDKVAPLSGVALPPAPAVQVPGVPVAVPPQATPVAQAPVAPLPSDPGSLTGGAGVVGNQPSVVTNPVGNVPMGYWWPRSEGGGGGVAPGSFCGREFISITDSTSPGPKAIYINGTLQNYGYVRLSPVPPGSYSVVIRNPNGSLYSSFVAQVPKCLGYTYING